MNYITEIIVVVILIFFLKGFLPIKGVKNISITELKSELKDKNIQMIDVRTVGEFMQYHIPGFKNIPLQMLAKEANNLKKDEPIIVICQSGMRSQRASKMLKKLGFNNIMNVKSGVSAWR
ncbi:rhodanese-like domain-containing protein [Lederbergia wuyishanensis]|uniref:Rhodanese-related sulfurtransferase n=1 Tax=Lederbergia wuyishanensis TaxID=1347903 RepID=A0ABU0D3Z6_9BACI|nr:rhodanese-like domain-containing protein [Lederbergia wuyishanensis]MCJ8007726.1 rhodanese-like domain-containing protein [Lederbergia wuyishanensis]MDQ0343111.1 rhodanese-related sulfurtransferase [Lederbergia wuyishanensis]